MRGLYNGVWLWNLENEEVLANKGLSLHEKIMSLVRMQQMYEFWSYASKTHNK